MKKSPWRVRVKLAQETWVEVLALDAASAELDAAKLPGVVSVFGKSAVPGNQIVGQRPSEGVQE